jgi:hypothetical protein
MTDAPRTHSILRKTGRRSNGGEMDKGPVYHAVPAASFRALCGTEPGDRSDWSTYEGEAVTCPRCIAKLAAEAVA